MFKPSQLSGLADKGMACGMRHVLTRFGSGWQGLDPGFSVTPESYEAGQVAEILQRHPTLPTLLVMKHGEEDVGFLSYSMKYGVAKVDASMIFDKFRGRGLGRSLYLEAAKHAKGKGALYFRSDTEGHVSEAAQKAWESGMKELPGVIEKIANNNTYVMKLTKLVMKSGEGAAVCKAGTGCVPAVLRRTSRIIKNSL